MTCGLPRTSPETDHVFGFVPSTPSNQVDGLAQALTIGEDFLEGAPSVLILGDNVFTVMNSKESLRITVQNMGATIFGYHVSDPSDCDWLISTTKGEPIRKNLRNRVPIMPYLAFIFMMKASSLAVNSALDPENWKSPT